MKNIFIVLICSAYCAVFGDTSSKLVLHFFGSPACEECAKIKTTILWPFADSLTDKIDLYIHNIETDTGLKLAVKMEERYKIKVSSPQELFFPDTFLLGYESIQKKGRSMIEQYLAHPEKWKAVPITVDSANITVTLKQRIHRITTKVRWMAVALAGVFAILFSKDAIIYKMTGNAKKIKPRTLLLKLIMVIIFTGIAVFLAIAG